MKEDKLKLLIKRTERITKADKKSTFELFASVVEEVGELAQALLVEEFVYGKRHKEIEESAQSESVDLIISAMAQFFERGGTRKSLITIMEKKLDKWSQQTKRQTLKKKRSVKFTRRSKTLSR